MKRCIVCGNIGNDDSMICSECGNAFVEMDDDMPQGDAPEDSLEKMEEQLKEMWARVQSEDSSAPAAQEASKEPELTVISDEPAEQEIDEEAADGVMETAAGENAEAEDQMKAAAGGIAEAETQMKAAAGEIAEAEAQRETAARTSVDMDALMKAAADKTADRESGAEEIAGQAAAASPKAAAEVAPEGQQTTQAPRAARTQPRRTKGGPQIYGQESMAEYNGAQGVIRRDVQGGRTAALNRTEAGNSSDSGRTVSRPPRRPAPSPMEENVGVQNISAEKTGNAAASVQEPQGNQARPVTAGKRPVAPQSPQGGQSHGPHSGKHAGAARRIMEAAQDALSSPLLIVIALLQTVYFVSAVAAIFLRQLNYGQTAKLLALLPLPSQISGYASMLQAALAQLDSGALVLNLVIRVPDLLFCIALWTLCITVRSAGEKMSGSGFLLMKISAILNMIASCAVFLLVLVVCVTFVIAAWNAGTTSLITIAVVLLVLAIIVTMAVIMYFFCYLSTIKTIRKNAVSGERYGNVSTYVAIVKMVVALTAVISILSGIVNLEITGITTGVGQLGWMILFGIWILKYKSTLSEYED